MVTWRLLVDCARGFVKKTQEVRESEPRKLVEIMAA